MSLTDLEIIQAVNALYGPVGSDPTAWAHLDTGAGDGIYWAVKAAGGFSLVIFRGSVTGLDWLRDLEAIPFYDRELGLVHDGFFTAMRTVWGEALPTISSGPWVACGHSLGAARAALLAGLGVVHGMPPAAVVLFGEPRPGGEKLASILSSVPLRSYRNVGADGHDEVTDEPPHAPIPFRHAGYPKRPLIDLTASSAPGDFSPFRFHHSALYEAATEKLSPMPTTR